MYNVYIKNTRTMSCCFGVFIVNFEHILHFFLMFLLLTLNKEMLAELCSTKNRLFKNIVKKIG